MLKKHLFIKRVAVKIRSIEIINLFANSFMHFCLSLPSAHTKTTLIQLLVN